MVARGLSHMLFLDSFCPDEINLALGSRGCVVKRCGMVTPAHIRRLSVMFFLDSFFPDAMTLGLGI
jgi:hypothetical protein